MVKKLECKPAGKERIKTKNWDCINEVSGDGQCMIMCFGKKRMLSFFDDGKVRHSKETGTVKLDGKKTKETAFELD